MTLLADRTISALRTLHDELEKTVSGLTDERLTGPSGASEWSVAQVLSHLGSGAEIALASYRVALDGSPSPADDFNQSVWDRWDALTPQEQAAGVLLHDTALVDRVEALSPEQRESVQIKLGFMPESLPLASIAGMRLNEMAQHLWDVQVGLDPAATIDESVAQLLAEHFAGGMAFFLGFIGKAGTVDHPTVVSLGQSGFSIAITGDGVALTSEELAPTATFHGPLESVMRLLNGRLTDAHTPDGVDVAGNVSLDELRTVFPGF